MNWNISDYAEIGRTDLRDYGEESSPRLDATEEDLGLLFRRNQAWLYRFVRRHAPFDVDAEQVTLDAFLIAFGKLEQLRDRTRFRSWIAAIARNLLISDGRRTAKRRCLQLKETAIMRSNEADPLTRFCRREKLSRAGRLLQDLPKQKRLLIAAVALGLTDAEIGRMLGISLSAIKCKKHRIRSLLREKLAG